MEREYKRKTLERMLKKCPDCLRPTEIPMWFPLGRNLVYHLINNGELRSYRMTYGNIIRKEDLIEYLLDHCDDSRKNITVKRVWVTDP